MRKRQPTAWYSHLSKLRIQMEIYSTVPSFFRLYLVRRLALKQSGHILGLCQKELDESL